MDRIDEYNESVDAISCLTEEDHFDGNVDYLKKIRTITELPILRKDFMIDPYQFYEAKAIGADAVLLIAAILDDAQMKDFYQLSKELELDALVEVHDEKELERAMKIDADIIESTTATSKILQSVSIRRYSFRNWYRKTKFWLRRVVSYRMRTWNF